MTTDEDQDEGIENRGTRSGLNLREMQNLFVELRADLIRIVSRRLGKIDNAADVAHDVYLKLPNIQATIPDRQQGRAYLFRMAGNLAIDQRRIEARRTEILTGAEVLFEDAELSPEMIAADREELRVVELALAELPVKCQEVLLLARVEGLRHKDIAKRLGISVSLVEKYQLRALRHCRERLDARS